MIRWVALFLLVFAGVSPAAAQTTPSITYLTGAPAVVPPIKDTDTLWWCTKSAGCGPNDVMSRVTALQLQSYFASGSGITQLTNDVTTALGTGTQPAVVAAIRGTATCNTTPTSGQLMAFNGTCWGPSAAPVSGINQLTGDGSAGPGAGSQPLVLAATGVAAGDYQFGANCATFDAKGRALRIVAGTCPGSGPTLTGGGNVMSGGGNTLIQ